MLVKIEYIALNLITKSPGGASLSQLIYKTIELF